MIRIAFRRDKTKMKIVEVEKKMKDGILVNIKGAVSEGARIGQRYGRNRNEYCASKGNMKYHNKRNIQ